MPHVGEKRPLPPEEPSGGGSDGAAGANAGTAAGDVEQARLEADVDRLLSEHSTELQAIERALRATIRTEFPDAVEQVDFGNKLIAFGRSMRMRGLLFAIIAHKTWVNLQLADGAELPDPDGLIEGTGKRIRHVKIRSVEAAGSDPVRTIMRAQLAARWEA